MQTRERRAKAATSRTAVRSSISVNISEGMVDIGQGGDGECSVGGGVGKMRRSEKEANSWDMLEEVGPSREWWAVFGTVTEALEGLGSAGFDRIDEGGKYLFLYALSTPASSYRASFSNYPRYRRWGNDSVGFSVQVETVP